MRTHLIPSTCIVLASLALAACGGGGDDSDKDAEGNDVRKTTLELGESATLTGPDDKYEVEVTIDAEEGEVGDLKDFRLEDDEAKMTPWYVRTKFTNAGKDDVTKDSYFGFAPDVLDDGGLETKEIGLLGDFPKCELVNMPDTFKPGESYESCRVHLVKEGATLDEIVVEETNFEAANERYTWKVS